MVAKPIDEYNELIRKYYGLIELTDSELNEAIEQLSSAIDNLESIMDYIRAQKVIRDRINCWIKNYGDLYDFNCHQSKCNVIRNEISRLTQMMTSLDYQTLITLKKVYPCLVQLQNINHQVTTLKRKYDKCIEPTNLD